MFPFSDGQRGKQIAMQRNRQLSAGLSLRNANCSFGHICPSHPIHVATTLSGVKEQCECKTLLGTDRPSLLKKPQSRFRSTSEFHSS